MSDVMAQVEHGELGEDEFEEEQTGVERVFPWILLIGGLIGAASAIMLTIEKINSLADKNYVPSCNFNPLISCGSVMNTPQGSAFGFANPVIGIFGFAVVITIGVALLCRASFPDWFWMGLLFGCLFGVGFIHWLFIESVFVIHKLCPYCMAVWIVMIAIFSYTVLVLFSTDRVGAPEAVKRPMRAIARFHPVVPIVWLLIIFGIIVGYFWDQWAVVF
ncbi:vitamin K epoxide reductase family protein [Sciscionella sediminilitoris]|uniref:vitamin K epoxide reductase family protein n=1 Tax=Sciscionella sediminilitoris TaxID=1445613 RepID=UPI00056D8569|nr:vitamin K epoxide reductase family protein [Sciscionella sp. SE31]